MRHSSSTVLVIIYLNSVSQIKFEFQRDYLNSVKLFSRCFFSLFGPFPSVSFKCYDGYLGNVQCKLKLKQDKFILSVARVCAHPSLPP